MTNGAATELGAAGGAALLFAGGAILARRGLHEGSLLSGLLISLCTGWIVMVIVVSVTSWPAGGPDWRAVALFGLAGLAAPGLGRIAVFGGIRAIGVSRAAPLQAATYPLIATAGGVILLAEPLSALQVTGTLLIIAGVTVVVSAFGGNRRTPRARLPVIGVMLPIAAGFIYATGDVLRAAALNSWAAPVVGAMIGLGVAAMSWLMLAVLVPSVRTRVRLGSGGAGWFVASGLCSAAAIVAQLVALSAGRVTVVSPIIATQPIIVVLLSAIFLKELEGRDWQRFAGSALTVIGAIVVAISGLAGSA